MITTTQLRVLRTSMRARPANLSIHTPPNRLPIRRHVPPCPPPSATPRPLSTTSLLLSAREASKSSTPTSIHGTQTAPEFDLSPTAANPPATTRPPPLDLPTRDPNQRAVSFYFATGKAYLTFYKTGLKNIYLNTRLVWSLNAAAGVPRAETPAPGDIAVPTTTRAVGSTTRSTLLLRRRWQYDVRRLPLFALLLLVCGEFTPLVVMALPSIVPYTCRIPRQIEAMQRKTEKRRAASFRRLYKKKDGIEDTDKSAQPAAEGYTPANRPTNPQQFINAGVSAHIARSLNLISPLWDRLGVPDAAVASLAARRKAKQHVAFLGEDDALLVQAGGVDALESEEVVLACADRAMGTVARDSEELRERLRLWLRYVPEQKVDADATARMLTDRLVDERD